MTTMIKIEKQFAQICERVKSVDLHPTQPWILAGLYSGTVCIWNHQSQAIEKSLKITESPVRSAIFITHKSWLVAGSDDGFVRVYNYETDEKLIEFKAHEDFIRSLAVHPSLPFLLSASDDKSVKLWDWENNWTCVRVFEGHSHYVMQAKFNPMDTNAFVTVSLDDTVMVWTIGSSEPSFTLHGHSKGVNCVDYFVTNDKTYLLTGSDDFTAKVWDYETMKCVQTLNGHLNNVTSVCVHPELPILMTCSEDETIRIWNTTTFSLENKLDNELGRVWTVVFTKDANNGVVFGCDKGITMVNLITHKARMNE